MLYGTCSSIATTVIEEPNIARLRDNLSCHDVVRVS